MFYLRLNRITIADNGAIKSGLGLFGHDFARVKFLSFVTTGNSVWPDLDRLLLAADPGEQAAIISACGKMLLQRCD